MKRIIFSLSALALASSSLLAGEITTAPEKGSIPDWVPSLQAEYLHQFDSDLDVGGNFSADRFLVTAGISRVFDRDHIIGISFGYSYDTYDFSKDSPALWSDIHTLRLGVPIRWKLSDRWKLFALPTLQSSAEKGASFSNSITGGLLAGASYTFGDHLTMGPGIGAISQLEDSMSVFPLLVIQWNITNNLKLETGSGFGATYGPGLNLVWQASENWAFTLGSRYEKFCFRLDGEDFAVDGVGEDRSIPVYLGASYSTSPFSKLSFYVGAKLGAELTLDNNSGSEVFQSGYDTAIFTGISWKYGF